MLTTVTITGADDAVKHDDLVMLSEEFPFVEWGILFSANRVGTPRYPSARWVHGLIEVSRGTKLRLSAHLCGEMARETAAGSGLHVRIVGDAFSRVQINGFVPPSPGLVALAHHEVLPEIILQVRDESCLQEVARVAEQLHVASALYDPSGGRGIESFLWPRAPLGLRLGYAGGIKPSTLIEVLNDIGPVDHDFWIDMESGVRTNDVFDLALVRQVLEQACPYVMEMT